MVMEAAPVGNKAKQCDKEVKNIHDNIKKSSLVLKQRLQDIQVELQEWRGGLTDGNSEGTNGSMH